MEINNNLLCKCGCGNKIKEGKIYYHGHNNKGKSKYDKTIKILCACGCGQELIKKWEYYKNGFVEYIHGHNKGRLNKKHTEQTKLKIGLRTKNKTYEKMYGKEQANKLKNKISNSNKGRIVTDKTREKIKISNLGKKLSCETKQKQREARLKNPTKYWLGKKLSNETINKMSNNIKMRYVEGKWISPMKDKHHTEEAKEKNRLAHLGNKNMLGKHHSELTKQKQSEVKLGKHFSPSTEFQKRDKNLNWNNGSSFEPYGLAFNKKLKEQIRARDNFRCQQCFREQNELFRKSKNNKIIKYKLHIHHIDYNKKNNNPSNLISLCGNCHIQTNYKRDDWTKYFNKKIETIEMANKELIDLNKELKK